MSGARHILVDGNNLLHRAHAVFVESRADDPMVSPSGYPTGLIYGFLSMLSDWVLSVARPTGISVFFDGVPRRRLDMDPDYKRKEDGSVRPGSSPASVVLCDGTRCGNELEVLKRLFVLMGADVYHGPDEEADDLIASFVASRADDMHVIISSDRDFYQLMESTDRVVLYRPGTHGNKGRFFDAERSVADMQEKFGVPIRPSDILMFKALTGDVSDNVPGVPRLRKKVAAPLCVHRDVDALLATGLPGLSSKEREKVVSMRDRISLNLRLVALDSSADLASARVPAAPDLALASRVLREDLGIMSVGAGSFHFAGSRPRQGALTSYDILPDYLKGI